MNKKEKEKEAIELLKQPPKLPFIYVERENAIRIVLKLIEKQHKEIEDLKVKYQGGYHKGFIDGRISMKYEGQDKIREKIKEVSNGTYDAKIILEKLLEEE